MKALYSLLFLLALLCGCRTQHSPIIENRTADSLLNVISRHDSIFIRDSIYVASKGDTVYKKEFRYIYRDRVIHDTLYHHRCDTITEVVEVEKQLSFWQQKKMELGGTVAWVAPLIIGMMMIKRKIM